MKTKLFLAVAAVIFAAIATPAMALTDISGNYFGMVAGGEPTVNDDVRLVGATGFGWEFTYASYYSEAGTWAYGVDVNAQIFEIQTGGGNPFSFGGAFTGTGSIDYYGGGYMPSYLVGTGANTYTGEWNLFQGTLALQKDGVDAINGTVNIAGGIMQWLNDGQVNPATQVGVFESGTLDVNAKAAIGGILSVNGATTLKLGGTGTIHFGNSSAAAWDGTSAMNITGWIPGTEQVFFGDSNAGLSTAQLAQIRFLDPANPTVSYSAQIGTNGVLSPVGYTPLPPATDGWVAYASGNWSETTNWAPTLPNGVDAVALFSTGRLVNDATVTVDVPVTVGTVTFDLATFKYTVAGPETITLQATGNAVINVVNGSHTLAAPVTLASNTAVTVADGCKLTLASPIAGAVDYSITYGPSIGDIAVTGANTYDGLTVIDTTTVIAGDTTGWSGNGAAFGSTVSGTILKSATVVGIGGNVTEPFTAQSDSRFEFYDTTEFSGALTAETDAIVTFNTGGGNGVTLSGGLHGAGSMIIQGGYASYVKKPVVVSGDSTLTGGLYLAGNTLVSMDGTLAHANITFMGNGATSENPGFLYGTGTIKFNDGEQIVMTQGAKLATPTQTSGDWDPLVFDLAAVALKFDLTALTGTTATLVDYTDGAFTAPATLNDLLTPESVTMGWSLTDTGTLITAALVARLIGDTNGDGTVDLTDLNNVRNNFGTTAAGVTGDTNGDGTVDLTDLNNVRNHFGESLGATNVPEPATLALLSLGGLALLRRRNSK